MAAILCNAVIHRQNAETARDNEARSVAKVVDWVEFPYEWQTKQTLKAVLFPKYGWVPRSAIAWRKPDGKVYPWSDGYSDTDTFLLAGWFVSKNMIRPS